MRIVAVIQARMGSTRLPGKVMKKICGKTVLGHVIERVQACVLLNDVVVATTLSPADDVIVPETAAYGAKSFRGSEKDVLERYYQAGQQYHAELIVRITADCPLFDAHLLTDMLVFFHSMQVSGTKIDYLSNSLTLSYPRGLDIEIFTFAALERAFLSATEAYEREHVTPYIYQRPEMFSLHGYTSDEDLSRYRWTLDTEEDLVLIEKIYAALYDQDRLFTTDQVIKLLKERPELVKINAHVEQKKLSE